ncbi:MAG: glycosyltransferase family A protein [Gemmatimonadetes bacterium]|nr:glycosyltransferase family A protein [Gemmatimonadota bacterium]
MSDDRELESKCTAVPVVSVGMPVFNGGDALHRAIDSILSQTFTDFELIISDNHSTDGTADVCAEYAARDRRVRYIRQARNIGAVANFEFVRTQARGRYFMWASADDVRSSEFLSENVVFLDMNRDYVASTSPHVMEGQPVTAEFLVTFNAVGTVEERFSSFFAPAIIGGRRYRNCWRSHGIFYSLTRRDVLLDAPPLRHYLALDWAHDLYLLSRGGVHRTSKGLAVFGAEGHSSSDTIYRQSRTRWIEYLLPFFQFSAYAMSCSSAWPLGARWRLFMVLADLNLRTTYGRVASRLRRLRAVSLASGDGGVTP